MATETANTSFKSNDASTLAPIILSGAASLKKPTPDGVQIAYIQITVRFLDETPPLDIKIDKLITGQELLDRVCEHLQLIERGYFGLRYDGSDNERYWLDIKRPVYKQLKLAESRVVHFRVRYYPKTLSVREEITRYQFFLQLRRDLYRGRLLCPLADTYELAALILQSEVGDYDAELCKPGYISEFALLPRQNAKLEERIAELHKSMVGMTPAEAENRLLNLASRFDTYGVDPFSVRPTNDQATAVTRNASTSKQDGTKRDDPSAAGAKTAKTSEASLSNSVPTWFIGVNHIGVVLFSSSRATRIFKWEEVVKLATDGRLFVVHTYSSTDLHTSISFTGGPLIEREEERLQEGASKVNGNGKQPPAADEQVKAKETEDAGPRTSAKLNKSTSVRETKKEREIKTSGAGDNVEQSQAQQQPTTVKSGGATMSRTGTMQRNSLANHKTTAYEFRCETTAAAKSLWLMAVDQQAFFTLGSSDEALKLKSADGFKLFARSAKFRFSGRCEREICEESSNIKRIAPNFERTPSTRITSEIRTRRTPSLLVATVRKDESEVNSVASVSPTSTENAKPVSAECHRVEEVKTRTADTTTSSSATSSTIRENDNQIVESISNVSEIVVSKSSVQVHSVPQPHMTPHAEPMIDISKDVVVTRVEPCARLNHVEKNQIELSTPSAAVPATPSAVRSFGNALVITLVFLVVLVCILAVVYETDLVEQPAKRFVGVSVRHNSAVAKLADLTYKPIKKLAGSLFRTSK